MTIRKNLWKSTNSMEIGGNLWKTGQISTKIYKIPQNSINIYENLYLYNVFIPQDHQKHHQLIFLMFYTDKITNNPRSA